MTTTTNKISFIDGVNIKLNEIPPYTDFKGKFVEQMDYDLCKIIDKYEDLHPATKTLFRTTVMENIKPNGDLVVKHNQRHKIGRFYADGDISLIPHARVIKHTLMQYGGWVDVDQCKGHSTIAVELFKLIARERATGKLPLVVASAMAGETNRLVGLGNQIDSSYACIRRVRAASISGLV